MPRYYQQDDTGTSNDAPPPSLEIIAPRIIDEQDVEELLRNQPAVNTKVAWELQEQRESAPYAAEAIHKQLNDEGEKIAAYSASLLTLAHRVENHGYDPSEAAIERKRITSLMQKAKARFDRTNQRARPAGFTFERLSPLFRSNKRLIANPVSKTFKRQDAANYFIEQRRREISDLSMQHDDIDAAALTADEAKATVIAYVDRLADEGRPGLRGLAYMREGFDGDRHQGTVSLPTLYVDLGEGETVEVFNALAFMAWRDPEGMKKDLLNELARVHDGKKSISLKARRALIAELNAKKLLAERLEEAAICWLRDNGYQYFRRYDADPLAVGQVRYATAKDIDFDFG